MESRIKASVNSASNVEQAEYIVIPVSGMPGYALIITSALNARIEHPGCTNLAYINNEADRYYCLRCTLKGRVSELWPHVQKNDIQQEQNHVQEVIPF